MPKRVIDMSLIKLILNGDKQQFRWILEEWEDIIYFHILKIVNNKETARDLTNETFVKAYLNLNMYNDKCKFSTWLYRIATNTAIDYLRKCKVQPDLQHQHEDHNQIVDDATTDDNIIKMQNYVTLKDAVNKLKPIYRNVIQKRYFEDMSYEEIANKLNMPIGTVKAYIHRAKLVLAKLIINQQK